MGRLKTLCAKCGTPCYGGRCPRHPARNEAERSARRGSSGWTRQQVNAEIIAKDGGRCYICGGYGANEVDHIVALGLDGTDTVDNLAAIHGEPCHRKKTAQDNRKIRARRNG